LCTENGKYNVNPLLHSEKLLVVSHPLNPATLIQPQSYYISNKIM
jgi:hypothetical protein